MRFRLLLPLFILALEVQSAVIVVGGNREARHRSDGEMIKEIAEDNGQKFYDVFGGTPKMMRENFIKMISEAKKNLKPGEPIVIQFTGHGFTSDPRDPKLSGVSTGNQQMVNYDAFAKMIAEHAGDAKIKLISTSCFGGGVHHNKS